MRSRILSNAASFKNICILLLLGSTIYLCFRNYKLSEANLSLRCLDKKTDTVYLSQPFKPNPFSQELEPERILVYRQPNLVKDSIAIITSHNNGQFSNLDSLVQVLLKKDQLNLSLFNKTSNTYSTRQFKINLDNYQYNWYEGQLTKKKTNRFLLKPYVYGKYRPFNNLIDLGSGIQIETNRFKYKLGVSAFCYPKLKSGLGTDLEFQITYNF